MGIIGSKNNHAKSNDAIGHIKYERYKCIDKVFATFHKELYRFDRADDDYYYDRIADIDYGIYSHIKKDGDETILFNSNTKFNEDSSAINKVKHNEKECKKINHTYYVDNIKKNKNHDHSEKLHDIFIKKCDQYDFFLNTLKKTKCDDIYDSYTNVVSNEIFHERPFIENSENINNSEYNPHRNEDKTPLMNLTLLEDVEYANRHYKNARKFNCNMKKFDDFVNDQSKKKQIYFLLSPSEFQPNSEIFGPYVV